MSSIKKNEKINLKMGTEDPATGERQEEESWDGSEGDCE